MLARCLCRVFSSRFQIAQASENDDAHCIRYAAKISVVFPFSSKLCGRFFSLFPLHLCNAAFFAVYIAAEGTLISVLYRCVSNPI